VLIEYETIDREQFQRLLAGEPAEDVFKDQEKKAPVATEDAPRKEPSRPRIGLPLPGTLAQGQPPESPQPS
jgi:hypothetical protein